MGSNGVAEYRALRANGQWQQRADRNGPISVLGNREDPGVNVN
jgi:hypothetical protein